MPSVQSVYVSHLSGHSVLIVSSANNDRLVREFDYRAPKQDRFRLCLLCTRGPAHSAATCASIVTVTLRLKNIDEEFLQLLPQRSNPLLPDSFYIIVSDKTNLRFNNKQQISVRFKLTLLTN